LKSSNPSRASLVKYSLYKSYIIGDKQHLCLILLPVFTLHVSPWSNRNVTLSSMYKVVQIWPGLFLCKQVTVCPGNILTTLYDLLIYLFSFEAVQTEVLSASLNKQEIKNLQLVQTKFWLHLALIAVRNDRLFGRESRTCGVFKTKWLHWAGVSFKNGFRCEFISFTYYLLLLVSRHYTFLGRMTVNNACEVSWSNTFFFKFFLRIRLLYVKSRLQNQISFPRSIFTDKFV
jgi:hypothetical protein